MPLAADTNLMAQLLQPLIGQVTFRSQVTPDFTYDPWAPAAEGPPPEGATWIMNLIRPAVILEPRGGEAYAIAPYGHPEEDYTPYLVFAGIAAVVGAIVLIGWIARKTSK